jgi:hypothetical protein
METPQRPQRRNEAIQGDPPDPITKEATVCAIIKAVHTTEYTVGFGLYPLRPSTQNGLALWGTSRAPK